jgi:hypothetical protein
MSNIVDSGLPDSETLQLLARLSEIIRGARQRALQAVDVVQVQTCWLVGQHIVEFEQGGQARAAYGKRLLTTLADSLSSQFGKGFDITNLRKMRMFYLTFPIRDTLRLELSWRHAQPEYEPNFARDSNGPTC